MGPEQIWPLKASPNTKSLPSPAQSSRTGSVTRSRSSRSEPANTKGGSQWRQLPRRSSRTTPPTVQGNLTPDTTATPSDGNARPAHRALHPNHRRGMERARSSSARPNHRRRMERTRSSHNRNRHQPAHRQGGVRAIGRRMARAASQRRGRRSDDQTHPAYQSIIDIGAEAVPWLLERLAQSPDHWFYALNQITDAQPVQPQHQGNINAMAEEWIAWGKQNQP